MRREVVPSRNGKSNLVLPIASVDGAGHICKTFL